MPSLDQFKGMVPEEIIDALESELTEEDLIAETTDVRSFGAVGDGVTNDTVALQNAIANSNGYVFFPPGVYLGRISLPSNTTVFGYGATLKLDASPGTADELVSVVDIAANPLVPDPAISNVKIYGLTIDGNRGIGGPYITYPDGFRQGIAIGNVDQVLIKDVHIKDCFTDGVFVDTIGPTNVVIDNVISENNFRHGAAIIAGTNITFRDSVLKDNGGNHTPFGGPGIYGDGMDVEVSGDVVGAHIYNCRFHDNAGRGVSIQSFLGSDITDVTIESCRCHDNGGTYDIAAYGSGSFTNKNLRILNNELAAGLTCSGEDTTRYENTQIKGNFVGGLILITGAAGTVVHSDLLIKKNDAIGVLMSVADAERGVQVTENTIRALAVPTAFTDVGISTGGFGSSLEGLVLSKNTVTGGAYGILTDAIGAIITENRVSGTRAVDPGGGYAAGWGISSSGTRCQIHGNVVDDVDTRGISSTGTYASIKDNRVTNSSGGPAGGAAGILVSGNDSVVIHNVALNNSGPFSFGDYYIDSGSTGLVVLLNKTTTGYLSNWEPFVNVRNYGAVGNGVADDTDPIKDALAASGFIGIYFPPGTYKFSENLIIPANTKILGNKETSILKPTAVVTIGLSLHDFVHIDGITLDGDDTSGATGILAGVDTDTQVSVANVIIKNFQGSGAMGLKVAAAVAARFDNLYINQNQLGALLEGVSLPTVTQFYNCMFRESTDYGVRITSAWLTHFFGCTFEASHKEGLVLDDAGAAVDVNLYQCWFEANCQTTGTYNMVCGNAKLSMRDVFFFGGPTGPLALQITSASRFLLDNVSVYDRAGMISIEDNAIGTINNPPAVYNPDTAVVVANTAYAVTGNELQWKDWTPSYSCEGSMTITGEATQFAKARQVGKAIYCRIGFTGTLGGVANLSVRATLPTNYAALDGNAYLPCYVVDGDGTIDVGWCRPVDGAPTGQLWFYKKDFSNWTLGASFQAIVCGVFEGD
jgi:hypothetical protein